MRTLRALALSALLAPALPAQQGSHLNVPAKQIVSLNVTQCWWSGCGAPTWQFWQDGQTPGWSQAMSWFVPKGYSFVILEIDCLYSGITAWGHLDLQLAMPGQPANGLTQVARVSLEAAPSGAAKTLVLAAGVRIPGEYGIFWTKYQPVNSGNLTTNIILRGYLVAD